MSTNQYGEILDFWFGESRNENRNSLWWHGIHPSNDKLKTKKDIDLYITEKWGKILESFPTTNEINLFNDDHPQKSWLYTVDGIMATIILFDQFPRHIYRGTKKSFSYDKYALILAEYLLDNHFEYMTTFYKVFCYVVLMHSEHKQSVENATYGILKLAHSEQDEKRKASLKKTASVSQEHLDVLVKFGRYPHRNTILGRVNTMEETDFISSKKLPLWMRSVSPDKASNSKKINKENKITNITLTESKNKLKILVLHSNRQSGQMFRSKTEHYLERKLKDIADLTYCDAPKLYKPQGEAESLIKDKEYTNIPNIGFTRAWWNASDDPQTMVYRGLDESLEYINSLFHNGHFDGIIGFSQGGTMAGIISALVSDFRKSGASPVPISAISKYLKFVVIISGFYCRDTRLQFLNSIMEELPIKHSPEHVRIRKDLITIPSFHTWGTSDNLVDPWRSEKLSQAFSDKNVHIHPSGHFIKAIKYWPVDEMCEWLGNFVPKESVSLIDYGKVALELFSFRVPRLHAK